MSRYNRYPVSGMTNVQIYTGTVSIQHRDTTTYRYTAHPYYIDTFTRWVYTQVREVQRLCVVHVRTVRDSHFIPYEGLAQAFLDCPC